ncbi:MAG: hypothetical protein EXQ49_07200 [Acidobacteria bacterium]|nr:hypothetical protein [Acidobacteriota bacterium]
MAKKPAKRPSKAGKPAKSLKSRKAGKAGKARKPARSRKAAKPAARKAAKKAVKKPVKKVAKVVKKVAKKKAAVPVKKAAVPPPARLQRARRVLPEAEVGAFAGESDDARLLSSARSGHDELRAELKQHTEASPELTAGDVDAKWQDAYALGDEAPGGDNMTRDQDRVDDIGKALGVEYADDEELMGGEEIAERDEHRWELDPESKEDDD